MKREDPADDFSGKIRATISFELTVPFSTKETARLADISEAGKKVILETLQFMWGSLAGSDAEIHALTAGISNMRITDMVDRRK